MPRTALITGLTASLLFCAPLARAGGVCQGWFDLGGATAGSTGLPTLHGAGDLTGGNLVMLNLDGAQPNAFGWLVLGVTDISSPFKGGILVPSPDVVLGPVPTDANGRIELTWSWAWGLPASTNLFWQWWIQDGAGPAGFAASNAVMSNTCDEPIPGTFAADWVSGDDCGNEPDIQIHEYGPGTYILRQSQCTNFEGPFMYLLFGDDRVVLHDSGAGNVQVRPVVDQIIADYEASHGLSNLPLIVSHTHSHGDHVQGDVEFASRPNTTVVGLGPGNVSTFFGFQDWPNDQVELNLGGRVIDVIAIPGHEPSSIAYYDRETGLLLTGDTFYPGFLFIFGATSQGNWAVYKASIKRMLAFLSGKPVVHVLGTHVEMTAVPGVAYPYGTSVQPNEHPLELSLQALQLLDTTLDGLPTPQQVILDEFIIDPFG